MKIAVAQINSIVGDLEGNKEKIMAAYIEAAKNGADLVVTPECVLTGYPLEDLVLRESFMKAVKRTASDPIVLTLTSRLIDDLISIKDSMRDGERVAPSLIYGMPWANYDPKFVKPGIISRSNSAFLIDPMMYFDRRRFPREGVQSVNKTELPNYGVFDEKRVFIPETKAHALPWRDHKIGLMICEDCWFPTVSKALIDDGAELIIAINGSPFEIDKNVTRRQVVANRIKETGKPFLYVNMVGGQDKLVFDGGSFLYDGNTIQEAPHFKEGLFYFDFEFPNKKITLNNYPKVEPSGIQAIYQACVLGTRDYIIKQGFESVVIGMSGGVDSGAVAAIASDAIGAENVHLVRLPSKYSSEGSLKDAADAAQRLGAHMRTINIEPVVESLRSVYATVSYFAALDDEPEIKILTGVADENIQARARGNILMAISNQEGHLLLTTGNKSECATGYSTLYGDMSGGFNPIKDCYKTTVWELCRWRNSLSKDQLNEFGFKGKAIEVVPEAIIVKSPSAELREDQFDDQSLPPYPILDLILKGILERELSSQDIADELKQPVELVRRVRLLVDRAEYKRRQAAPGVKITSKIFGRDRRYPIVNHWVS